MNMRERHILGAAKVGRYLFHTGCSNYYTGWSCEKKDGIQFLICETTQRQQKSLIQVSSFNS
jgi:hypothetical protein